MAKTLMAWIVVGALAFFVARFVWLVLVGLAAALRALLEVLR